ncbi:hypothetical protein ACWD00_08515 [Streptomyces viridiviolaceus]
MSWLDIDYDPDCWVEIPSQWTLSADEEWLGSDRSTPEEWARDIAEDCWEDSEEEFTSNDVSLLSQTLLECVHRYPGMYPGFEVLLYLPDPRMIPLPVWITHLPAEGDTEGSLRELTLADESSAIEPPVAEQVSTKALGKGLRVLRYSTAPASQELVVGLRYAWRSTEHGRDVLLITGSPAPGQVMVAVDAIAELIHQIRLRHDDYVFPTQEGDG